MAEIPYLLKPKQPLVAQSKSQFKRLREQTKEKKDIAVLFKPKKGD